MVLVFFAPFLMYFSLIYYILDFEEFFFVAMETSPVAMEALGGRWEMGLRLKMFILWSKTNVQCSILLRYIAQKYCIFVIDLPDYMLIGNFMKTVAVSSYIAELINMP